MNLFFFLFNLFHTGLFSRLLFTNTLHGFLDDDKERRSHFVATSIGDYSIGDACFKQPKLSIQQVSSHDCVRCKRIRMHEKRRNENTRAVVNNLSRRIFRSSPEEIFRAKVSPTCCYLALRKFPMALTPDLACANLTELCS